MFWSISASLNFDPIVQRRNFLCSKISLGKKSLTALWQSWLTNLVQMCSRNVHSAECLPHTTAPQKDLSAKGAWRYSFWMETGQIGVSYKKKLPYGGGFKFISLARWLVEDRYEDIIFLEHWSYNPEFLMTDVFKPRSIQSAHISGLSLRLPFQICPRKRDNVVCQILFGFLPWVPFSCQDRCRQCRPLSALQFCPSKELNFIFPKWWNGAYFGTMPFSLRFKSRDCV